MIDISFLLVSYLLPWTRAKHVVKGTQIPFPWVGVLPASKIDWRHAQPLRSHQLPFTTRVNGTMNGVVICVFHAPFTVIAIFRNWRAMAFYKIGIEEHGSIGSQL